MNQLIQDPDQELENKLGNVSLDRADLYQLLIRAVQFPTLMLAESLWNGSYYSKVEKSVQWVNDREGIYQASLEKLKKVAENKTGNDPVKLLKKMKEDYTHLFLTPNQTVVSPFETDYGQIAQDLVVESLNKVYNKENCYILPDSNESIDHICTEFSFLSHLCLQEGISWKNGEVVAAKKWKMKQRAFTVHHLRKWGISFFENVGIHAELEAYQAIASVGKMFMILEHGN
ncbi:molecular chaperone [Cytobacillus sp. Hz8]|uniref:TorD/DmsD family molecular chaperone n=1 Tax=Cytobacillus sp. Hz8 TaxID=3347168 RepID=UPI0035D60E65